jgi:urea transport system substrate-binding protein
MTVPLTKGTPRGKPRGKPTGKPKGKLRALFMASLAIIAIVTAIVIGQATTTLPPIKVGILHSLSGTLAISEQPVVDSLLMAIAEINQQGGVLGHTIQPVIVDGKSDWKTFAEGAEQLITKDKVVTVFGCWTSASRKTVKPIFEKYQHLLIYPVQYEGLEESAHIIYTGAAPNQQIIPAVQWSFSNLGKRFFLVGSEYVFPRAANAIITAQVKALQGQIVGEEYLLLGSNQVDQVVAKIKATRPDVILNTINGDTNLAFFRALRQAGITPQSIPTVSFSIAETELQQLGTTTTVAGDYAVWNYFQSIDSPANRQFVANFQSRYGHDRVVNDPMEAAYFGVHLWAQAVAKAQSLEVSAIRSAILRQSFNAPQGVVYIDPQSQHTWKTVRVGKIRNDGQFDIVWSSERPVRPVPYPIYRSRQQWQTFLNQLYEGWNNNWANLG